MYKETKAFPRLFISAPVSDPIREQMAAWIAEGQSIGLLEGCRMTLCQPEQYHVTLVFLGATYPRLLRPLQVLLREAAERFSPFPIFFSGLGVIPTLSRPRVLLARVQANPTLPVKDSGDDVSPLFMLHHQLAERIRGLGMALESRPYMPHVTLGRIRHGRFSARGERWLTERASMDMGRCIVNSVHLMESQPTPQGSLYSSRSIAYLGGGERVEET